MEVAGVLLPAIDRLSQPIGAATTNVIRFTSQFNTLALTLTSVKPLFDDVQNLNRLLDRPYTETESFTQLLSEGEQLVQRCSRIKKWDVINRWRYYNKLTKFGTKLLNFYWHVLPLLQLREVIRISARLCGVNEQLPNENPTTEENGLPEISCPVEMPLLEEEVFGDR